MKKFYLLMAFTALLCGFAEAQVSYYGTSHDASRSIGSAKTQVAYHGEVDLGYSIGVGNFSAGRINLHTIQGVQVGEYFSAGVGIGLDYYHDGDGGNLIMPIYLNVKGYLPVNNTVSPYLSLDLGEGICLSEDIKGFSGLYCTPAIGVKVNKFKVQLGYNVQRLSDNGVGVNFGAIQLKVGMMF
jgi:hypothetical protein